MAGAEQLEERMVGEEVGERTGSWIDLARKSISLTQKESKWENTCSFYQRHRCKMHNAMKTQANLESSLKGINLESNLWQENSAPLLSSFYCNMLPEHCL